MIGGKKPKEREKKTSKQSNNNKNHKKYNDSQEKKKSERTTIDVNESLKKLHTAGLRNLKQLRFDETRTPLEHNEWFWGMISQSEAEEYLSRASPTQFLVRSTAFQQECSAVILSVVLNNQTIAHLQVKTEGAGWKWNGNFRNHKSVADLISFHQKHKIPDSDIYLGKSAPRPDWILKTKDIIAPSTAKRLGGGNFSEVVIGAFRRRLVAVKKLTSSGDRLMLDRDALMREATIMKKVEHKFITKMIGISLDTQPPMLLVELMAGCLDKHLEVHGEKTQLGEKLLYCYQIATAVHHMHSHGYVHRDLAARNALISRYGIVKLSDFGLSDTEANNSVNIAKEAFPVKWMAPESIKNVSAAVFNSMTDVWSFGVVVNEIFQNGKSPLSHLGEIDNKVLVEKLKNYTDDAPLHVPAESVPPELLEDIKKCWLVDPTHRPSIAVIVANLETAMKMRYFPPPLEERTVRLIRNCTPLTLAEYECLYANNLDWLPAVKKVRKVAKKDEKRRPVEKLGPRQELQKMKRQLRRLKKQQYMEIRIQWWRRDRRETREKRKKLDLLQKENPKTDMEAGFSLQKRIRLDEYKLVELYHELMSVKYRKRQPSRFTCLRLRPRRIINRFSKHPSSRNGKSIRVINPRPVRRKHERIPKPIFLRKPRFKKKKKNKIIETPGSDKGDNMEATASPMSKLEKKGTQRANEDAGQKEPEKITRKGKRKLRRQERRKARNYFRKARAKRKRAKRRRRRRMKRRRRYRRTKRVMRRAVLTWAQMDRVRELVSRRKAKRRMEHRRRKRANVGRMLKHWIMIRQILLTRNANQMTAIMKTMEDKMTKKSNKVMPTAKSDFE